MKPTLKFAPRCGGPKAWERGAVIGDDDTGLRVPVRVSMTETGRRRVDDSEEVTDADGNVFAKVVDDRKRTGAVHAVSVVDGQVELGKELWSGPVSLDATPLRATCVAAGLVDTDGRPLPLPSWVPQG